MKATPGYKVCPTRKQPAKAQTAPVTKRRAFAADAAKDVPSLRKVTKRDTSAWQVRFPSMFLKRSSICFFQDAALESRVS